MAHKAFSHIGIGLLTVFIAIFTLFYVVDSLDKVMKKCETGEPLAVCSKSYGFTLTMIIILLVVGGFVVIISTVVYIMLSG